MTNKTKLVWRLGNRPTTIEVINLVETKLITQDEAREILFNTETEEDRDKKSLQSEIKFLRELVEKLSDGKMSRIVEVIREVEKPIYIDRNWYQPYQQWYTVTSGTDPNTVYCATATGDIYQATNFTDIQTF